MEYDEYLEHYGVKGMKWGVRKDRQSSNSEKTEELRKEKIKKVAITTAVVSTAAVSAYMLHKYSNTSMDKTIKSGKALQRMSRWMDEPVKDTMYASHLKGDNKKYRTWFAAEKGAVHVKNIVANKDIKIAGKKTSLKAFEELVNSDSEMSKRFGGDIKRAYNTFNRSTLSSPDVHDKELANKFYKKLAEKGYSAVRDRNDQMYSGIDSPLILFNAKENISVKDTRKITRDSIPKKYKKMYDISMKYATPYTEDVTQHMEMNEYLEHYGIKGMKWGVRRPVGPDGTVVKTKSRTRKSFDSAVREIKTAKNLRNLDGKSEAEIRKITDRVRNENALKDLTPKNPVTKKGKAKKDVYLDRAKMSDKELAEKVKRLRVEDNLKKEIKRANQGNLKAANKVIKEASKVALNRYTDGKGNFSATGNDTADILLRESLKYAKQGKVIKGG